MAHLAIAWHTSSIPLMIDWFTTVISPILGAGASSVFKRWLNTRQRQPPKEPPSTLTALGRQLGEMQEWQADAQEVLLSQERRLQKLRKEIRSTRILLDIFLLLLLSGIAAWYFWSHHLPR